MATFGGQIGRKIGPRGVKMDPRTALRASKYRKPALARTLNKSNGFGFLGGTRLSKTASGGPRLVPRSAWRAPKSLKKEASKNKTDFLSFVWPIVKPFWGPFRGQKLLKTGSKKLPEMGLVLKPLPPPLRHRHVAQTSFLRSYRKGPGWLQIYPAKERFTKESEAIPGDQGNLKQLEGSPTALLPFPGLPPGSSVSILGWVKVNFPVGKPLRSLEKVV